MGLSSPRRIWSCADRASCWEQNNRDCRSSKLETSCATRHSSRKRSRKPSFIWLARSQLLPREWSRASKRIPGLGSRTSDELHGILLILLNHVNPVKHRLDASFLQDLGLDMIYMM